MPIDPRIALGYQPPQQPSPMNIMAQMQALQNARQENAMRQAQMENYASEVSRRNALLPAELAAAKSRAETEEAARKKGEHELAVAELDRQMDHVALVNNQAGWTAWRNGVVAKDPNYATYIPEEFTPDNKVSALSTAKTARDQIAKDLETTTVSLGGTTEGITRTGKTMWSRKETMSPDAAARNARETSDSVEMSPEQIDYYANLYNQTQTLPSLGMGATPLRQKILSRAAQIGMADGASPAEGAANVVANAQTRAAEKKTLTAFTSGVEARRVTANNTAVNHLATMETLADGLANSDIRISNAAKNAFAKATGQAAPASFDAAKQLVAAEVIKAVVNNGGGVKEREEAASQFARANSPEQLKAVIQSYKELLGGQLSSLQQQYETGTGRKDFATKLSPRTRELLSAGAPAAGGGDLAAAARAELERRRTAK